MALGAFQTERLVKTLSEMPLGARLARFWGAPMPPVTSRERPRAPRERPNDVPERLRSLSGASPERPGSAPRRARALQGGPGASRGRIGVRFGGQIGHKRCIFRCFFEHSVIMLLIQQSPRFCISIRFFFFPSGAAVCAQHMEYGPVDRFPLSLAAYLTARGASLAPHVGSIFTVLAFPSLS